MIQPGVTWKLKNVQSFFFFLQLSCNICNSSQLCEFSLPECEQWWSAVRGIQGKLWSHITPCLFFCLHEKLRTGRWRLRSLLVDPTVKQYLSQEQTPPMLFYGRRASSALKLLLLIPLCTTFQLRIRGVCLRECMGGCVCGNHSSVFEIHE